MRKIVLVVMVAIGLATIFLVVGKKQVHRKELTAYFSDVKGLRVGAPIRLAGVHVGSVLSLRARPDLRDNPAEVRMGLRTEYELSIPKDSVVSVATAGLLGETYLNIDVHEAGGPPIEDHGVLKSRASSDSTPSQLVEHLAETLSRKASDPSVLEKNRGAGNSTSSDPVGKH